MQAIRAERLNGLSRLYGLAETIVGWLAGQTSWAYHGDAPLASEPAALTAMALLAHDRNASPRARLAHRTTERRRQRRRHARVKRLPVGRPPRRCWPGPWPIAARPACVTPARSRAPPIGCWPRRGIAVERYEELGHDSSLIGWPWVEGTHSWIEPTAWAVLALKAVGLRQHPRTREAVRLLVDRLLPEGGCNFGNTYVLGQQLLPHLQSSGICLLALAGEKIDDPRIDRTSRLSRTPAFPPHRDRVAQLQPARSGGSRSATWPRPTRCWPPPPNGCWSAIAVPTSCRCWPWPPRPPTIR